MTKTTLITGVQGFIGNAVAYALLQRGDTVIGMDFVPNVNWPVFKLKRDRLARLTDHPNFHFKGFQLEDGGEMNALWALWAPHRVIHLAAATGIRDSFVLPVSYIDSNITGFQNVLEMCHLYETQHLVFASSSSVYGTAAPPFSISTFTDNPISPYAATKKANEVMAHVYHHAYGMNTTGCRFFTVYGPWGRPDMAIWKFTKAIIEQKPISVFGEIKRDFIYIDDVVTGLLGVLDEPNGYTLYNFGTGKSHAITDVIGMIENHLNMTTQKITLPAQRGDMPETCVDIGSVFGNDDPTDVLNDNLKRFIDWYQTYHGD